MLVVRSPAMPCSVLPSGNIITGSRASRLLRLPVVSVRWAWPAGRCQRGRTLPTPGSPGKSGFGPRRRRWGGRGSVGHPGRICRSRIMCSRVFNVASAIGAAVARFVHTEEVTGSIPVSRTERRETRSRKGPGFFVPAPRFGSASRSAPARCAGSRLRWWSAPDRTHRLSTPPPHRPAGRCPKPRAPLSRPRALCDGGTRPRRGVVVRGRAARCPCLRAFLRWIP